MDRRINVLKDGHKIIFYLYEDKYVGRFIITIGTITNIDSISIVPDCRGRDLSTLFWNDHGLKAEYMFYSRPQQNTIGYVE
jgi:hypothetical protein